MNKKYKGTDLTGQQFGRLTVIGFDNERIAQRKKENKMRLIYWVCKCTCGNIKSVITRNLVSGSSTSCGCLSHECMMNTAEERGRKAGTYVAEHYTFNGTVITTLTQKISKNNKTGVKGVFYDRQKNKFIAGIMLQRKRIHLGSYETLEDAAAARAAAEAKYFKPIIEEFKELMEV